MDEIPFVEELEERFESAIRDAAVHRAPRGPAVAFVAFAVTIVLLGGATASIAAAQRGLVPSPGAVVEFFVGHVSPAARSEAPSAEELAKLIPVPPLMEEVADPLRVAGEGVATRKFVMEGVDGPAAITVTVVLPHAGATDRVSGSGRDVMVGTRRGLLIRSSGMTVLEWESGSGAMIQIAARGDLTETFLLGYAARVDQVVSTGYEETGR